MLKGSSFAKDLKTPSVYLRKLVTGSHLSSYHNIKQLKNRKLACLEHSNQGNMLL